MSHDPAKEPCSSEYHNPECCYICGPSGNKNMVNQNEKGMLEQAVFDVVARTEYALLGSNHDAHKQGIYTTNSVGDRD